MWTIVIVLASILAVTTAATRDTGGSVTEGGSISATALQVGDCVNGLRNSTNLSSLPGVPCTQPHEGEVFAVFDLPAGDYPGSAAVDDQVSRECNDRLTAYSPSAGSDPDVGLFSVYPLEQNWSRGDRQVVCLATARPATPPRARSRASDGLGLAAGDGVEGVAEHLRGGRDLDAVGVAEAAAADLLGVES